MIKYGNSGETRFHLYAKSVKYDKNKNIFTTKWLNIQIVLQQVTPVRDSCQYTSNLYKKMGAFY